MEFEVNKKRGYIELYNLLKSLNLCASGGEAKHFIKDGEVIVNGEVETRKGRKVRPDDTVEFMDNIIELV